MPRDHVLCVDEKTSIQARPLKHRSLPPAPGRAIYFEHEYERAGALAYVAAWDVHRARLLGRCERENKGSCRRGRRAADRLRTRWPNIVLVHTPVHASWLNQIEVYFSVVQRKLLTPSDFGSLADLKRNVMAFQTRHQRAANPFKWTFRRRYLHVLLTKLRKRRRHAGKLGSRNTSP